MLGEMAPKNLCEYLQNFCRSPEYNCPIDTFSKVIKAQLDQAEIIHESLSNEIEILPPAIWFIVDHGNCLPLIRNDVEKSLNSKSGFMTSIKGNNVNEVLHMGSREDISSIQSSQDCFCISYAVIKEDVKECIKNIGQQLRSCLIEKACIAQIHPSSSNCSMDDITREIYKKYRVFLIFDTKTQPGRVLANHCCYYPNIKFHIQKINFKENKKFSPNDVFKQFKQGRLCNTYGFLSLDRAERLLMVKKEEPDISSLPLTGVWIVASFPAKRTRKQFGKQDAIWQALFDFYTNKELKSKISISSQGKGILCYFMKNSRSYKYQMYLFDLHEAHQSKWVFASQSEVFTDWTRPHEVKFDFSHSTILEEKQCSEQSEQSSFEEKKLRNENLSMDSFNPPSTFMKNSAKSGQGRQQRDAKDTEISQLKQQLEGWKKKCFELEVMNKILIQEKLMATQMAYPIYANSVPHQMIHPYAIPNLSGNPLSYSQVSANNLPRNGIDEQQLNAQNYLVESKVSKASQPRFPPILPVEEFKIRATEDEDSLKGSEHKSPADAKKGDDQTPELMKKKLSQQEHPNKGEAVSSPRKSETIGSIFVRPDARNISFQDSFVECFSDREKELVSQKVDIPHVRSDEHRSCGSQSEEQEDKQFRSPSFKRFQSEEQPKQKVKESNAQAKIIPRKFHSPNSRNVETLKPRKTIKLESDDSGDEQLNRRKAPISPKRNKIVDSSEDSDAELSGLLRRHKQKDKKR